MMLARHHKFPDIKSEGIQGLGKLVMFASEDAHYSFVKGSIWMGHGSQGVIKVKTDESGRLDPIDLEVKMIEQLSLGSVPFMIACTSGTTVLSAFDPIHEVVKIGQKYGVWVHVDACLGGSALFSSKHRHLLKGIEDADSVSWNLHKLGVGLFTSCSTFERFLILRYSFPPPQGIPLQASLFMTRYPSLLRETNCLNAEYLFQKDKYYDDSYDSGDKSIQCGRKVDCLKVYLALLGRGRIQTERLIDNVFDVASYATAKMRVTPGFKLVLENGFEGGNVCFWFIPSSLRKEDGSLPDTDILNKVCPAVKERMMTEGKIMVNYQPLSSKKLPNFFRLVLTCLPPSTKQDIDVFVDEVARLAESINWEPYLLAK